MFERSVWEMPNEKYLALPALRIPGGPPRRPAAEGARTRPGSNKN